MKYHLISVGYNCEQYIEGFVQSIAKQGDYDTTVHICDDCSTDNTWERLQQITDRRFYITRNDARMGAAYSRYHLIKRVVDLNSVILLVDLDDELLEDALKTINIIYQENPDIWLTYGNWIDQHGRQNPNISYPEVMYIDNSVKGFINKCIIRTRIMKRVLIDRFLPPELRDENRYIFYPDEIVKTRAYRQYPSFLFTHLRTFKRFLFEAFEEKDFQDENGHWLTAGTDTPLLGILEQCAAKNVRTVSQPLYMYRQHLDRDHDPRKNNAFQQVKKQHAGLKKKSITSSS